MTDAALVAFRLLGKPIYIYSFNTRHVCWANELALAFWDADSERDLLQRKLTPYSAATEIRLEEYRNAFRQGEDRIETWTLYPKGVPTATLCRCSGISMDGHPEAMLVEIQTLTPGDIPGSELRALEALRHSPLMISLFSADGRIFFRNPAATACFRKLDETLPEEANHLAAMFANRSDYHALLDDASGAINAAGFGEPARCEAVMALDGGPIHAVNLTVVSDPLTGQSARLVAQEDVTRAVQVHRQLAASEEAFETILNMNAMPMLIVSNQSDRILGANFAASDLFKRDFATSDQGDGVFAKPSDYDAFRTTMLSGPEGHFRSELQATDGTTFQATLSGLRVAYQRHDAIVVRIADVAPSRPAATEPPVRGADLLGGDQHQRKFLAMASHEFRTPLAIIDSVAQRMERGAENHSADQVRSAAQRIRRTVKRSLDLLEKVMNGARASSGTLGYEPRETDLAILIGRVVRNSGASDPALKIKVNLPSLPPLMIDNSLMERVIGNLISNSRKYSVDELRIEIAGKVSSEDVQITFRDWGIGIPEHERTRVFSDYVRGSNVGQIPGSGLGLSIVNQILALHGGMIDVVDHDGPGVMMRITLPRI